MARAATRSLNHSGWGVAYQARVERNRPPAEFDASHALTEDERREVTGISREALDALERCIESRHVAEVGYTDAGGKSSTISFRPAYIRSNSAHHIVVWGMPLSADHWEELRLDRIRSVEDTGDPFTPSW